MKPRLVLGSVLLVAVLACPATSGACEPPSGYLVSAAVIENGLQCTLAIDRPVYLVGEPVQFFLSVKNLGIDTVTVSSGVSPLNAFLVMPDTCTSPQQPGCFSAATYVFPGVISFFGSGVALAPGQCETWTDTWDGRLWDESLPSVGRYTVMGGLFNFHGYQDPVDFVVPEDGVLVPMRIVDVTGVPEQRWSWGLIKQLY